MRGRSMTQRASGRGLAARLRALRGDAAVVGSLVAAMWVEEGVDAVLGGRLDAWGIQPRQTEGLWGILLAPFLHAGFEHLAANTAPLLVLGSLVVLRSRRVLVAVSSVVVACGGMGVWLVGATGSVHLGASGLVFGWLGFLMLVGLFERKVLPALGSLLVAKVYGAALVGVLPGVPGISWESHLFGFLAGAAAAWLFARPPSTPRMPAR